jgi:DNA polymerase-3 subunit delta'
MAKSYLFFGPEGVGRALTAKAFLAAIMCRAAKDPHEACLGCPTCMRVNELSHPDIMWVNAGKNKKIKIEDIRKARDILNLKPYEASLNACVIEDAHMMTQEASNALLKVLEEPPAGSLLILISSKKELLLPTVISRCTEVRFNPLPVDQAKDIIMNCSELDEESAYFLAYFSEGSPGKALEVVKEGVLRRKEDLAGALKRIAMEKDASCLTWDQERKDVILEDLELLIMFFRDIVLGKEGLQEFVLDKNLIDTEMYRFFKEYPVEKISNIIEKLISLKQALLGNVNPKLVAQALPGYLK